MSAGVAGPEAGFVPVPVVEVELADETPLPEPNARGQLVALVRLEGYPLGVLDLLEPGSAGGVDLRARARTDLAVAVAARAGVVDPPASPTTSVTVAVCTLGQDPRLVDTVRTVLGQSHPALELVVVDNAPDSGRVPALLAEVDDLRLRVVPQPRRGLSAARNAAVAAATGEVLAFTDDDAFADVDWVARLVAPFAVHPSVVCTTGLVLPAALETPAQLLFEEFGAFDKGFDRVVWAMGQVAPEVAALGRRGDGGILFPYSAGVFGSGNNMAFRLGWLRGQPLFDEALGAGSPAKGGEDLDAYLTVMLAGAVLVYEPAAVVKHYAREEMSALRTQMFGYGSGMSALVAKHALVPRRAFGIARRLPAGLRKLLASDSDKNENRGAGFPRELVLEELKGYAAGPALYARGRWRNRRLDRA